jgi:hypothetical protein
LELEFLVKRCKYLWFDSKWESPEYGISNVAEPGSDGGGFREGQSKGASNHSTTPRSVTSTSYATVVKEGEPSEGRCLEVPEFTDEDVNALSIWILNNQQD